MKKVLLFFTIMCMYGLLVGQPTMQLYVNPFNVIYPSAFDKDNPADQPIIFNLNLQHTNDDTLYCKLAMELINPNYDKPLLSKENGLITSYDDIPGNTENDYLLLYPNQYYSLTNRDIIKNSVTITGSWNDIVDEIPDFEDFVLSNGYFPSGTYFFTFYLFNLEMEEIEHSSASISVSNEMQVNLLAPGTEVSTGQSIDLLLPISDNAPTFAWQSTANSYTFRLWELDPFVFQAIHLDDLSDPFVEIDNISQLYYQYETHLPVMQNQYIYIWNVNGNFNSTLGEQIISSEYYGFKYQEIAEGEGDPTVQNLIDNLTALGLIDPGQLGGFNPTGYVYINGEQISFDMISDFLNGLFNGKYEIESIVIE